MLRAYGLTTLVKLHLYSNANFLKQCYRCYKTDCTVSLFVVFLLCLVSPVWYCNHLTVRAKLGVFVGL